MPRIVLQLDADAPPAAVRAALDSQAGIEGWWTDDVVCDGGAGSTMSLGFPVAPMRFELRVDEAAADTVRWTSVGAFPPHWADTAITWTLRPAADGAGTTIAFSHAGWADDGPLMATAALTWAQLMLRLRTYAETGAGPALFSRSAQPAS